jgi:hypothetical protein
MRLAQTLLAPAERAEKARAALHDWNGRELERRLARATAP